MRKKERQLVTIGLIVLFGVIAYWAYAGGDIGFIDLNNNLNNNETTESYNLGISDLQAVVLDVGDVKISFSIANADKFNITSVKLYYALNVADPANATYTAVSLTANNGTYETTIDTKFGDVLYYYIEIQYVENGATKVFRYPTEGYESVTVSDAVAPTISNVTVSYDASTGNATFTISASDNDAIDYIILFYAITADGNATSFSNVTLTTSPYEITLTIDENVTDATYYYVDFYVEAYDLSGNSVRLPANGTFEFYANETASLVFPQSG
ncbi:MAG: hypothetical protein DRJ03_17225 [Chloroflexi bacterium]|nr:MAG: hypothetical protein DRJ03_17225 [Chloroflexota bacterium]